MSAKIHAFNTQDHQKKPYKKLIDDIHNCLNEQLSDLLATMFNGADDVLFHLAENADSNEQQTQYFDTMRLLRTERKSIGQNFADALKTHLKPISLIEKEAQERGFPDEELTLVDQDTMEEMVAIASMHSKAMNLFGEAVNHLEARLEVLAMKTSHIFEKQAIIPRHIGESFQQALEPIELSANSKIILYKLFDQEVCSRLAKMYQMLNKLLIDADILPQISLGKVSRPSPAPAAAATDSSSAIMQGPGGLAADSTASCAGPAGGAYGQAEGLTGAGPGAYANVRQNMAEPGVAANYRMQSPASAGTAQGQLNHVVHKYLHGELSVEQGAASFSQFAGASPQGQYYDKREVVKALSNLQLHYANDNPQISSSADFKRAIMKDVSRRNGGALTKQVNQIDEKTIDFIEMLFEAIDEDSSISDLITNLLLRLQIPVIKAAMLDEDFFNNGEHPARYTLNLIAHVGKGINAEEDPLYKKLEVIVKHLLEEYDVDVTSFQNAIDKLNLLIQDEDEQQIENETRTQQETLREHARQMILSELQHHSRHKVLPKAVQPLILKHWSTLLFHHYIKAGKDSPQWRDTVSLLKLIIKSLQPIKNEEEWTSVKLHHASLTEKIKDVLYATKQNRDDIDTAIQALQTTYNSLLESSEYKPDATRLDDMTETDGNTDPEDTADFNNIVYLSAEDNEPSPVEIEAERADEKLSALPTDIRPGAWFEIHTGEDTPMRRLKLSVIIVEEARLIFVDRIGVKKMEKDADEFAAEMASGQSKMIADHSIFDHALGNVINALSASA